jgi:hypothetical protein
MQCTCVAPKKAWKANAKILRTIYHMNATATIKQYLTDLKSRWEIPKTHLGFIVAFWWLLDVAFIMAFCWLRLGFILSLSWLSVDFLLVSCWLHVGCILSLCWLHIFFMLASCWLYLGFMLAFSWLLFALLKYWTGFINRLATLPHASKQFALASWIYGSLRYLCIPCTSAPLVLWKWSRPASTALALFTHSSNFEIWHMSKRQSELVYSFQSSWLVPTRLKLESNNYCIIHRQAHIYINSSMNNQ